MTRIVMSVYGSASMSFASPSRGLDRSRRFRPGVRSRNLPDTVMGSLSSAPFASSSSPVELPLSMWSSESSSVSPPEPSSSEASSSSP